MRDALDRYLALRRAAGFELEGPERMLGHFVRFATRRGDRHVKQQTAHAWAAGARTRHSRGIWLQTVIIFARFLHAEDPRHEIPANVFPHTYRRPPAYIYSDREIVRLLAQAARLGPKGSLRPHTFTTLFGLLAVTGLRVSEALRLRIEDITSDGLLILETKYRKSRLVPVHETTSAQLARYLERRRAVATDDEHLFISRRRTALSYGATVVAFHQARQAAGIVGAVGRRKVCRIHDLRHTFAVRTLERSPSGRIRVDRHMVALSTYLGHATVHDTYYYLRDTPQLLADIAAACDSLVRRT